MKGDKPPPKTGVAKGMTANKTGKAAGTSDTSSSGSDKYSPEDALNENDQETPPPPNTQKEVGEPGAAPRGTLMEVDLDPSLSGRVDDYLRKTRMAEIKAKLGKDFVIYSAINAKNVRDSRAPNLLGGGGEVPVVHSQPLC
jgi:hypothetical protein